MTRERGSKVLLWSQIKAFCRDIPCSMVTQGYGNRKGETSVIALPRGVVLLSFYLHQIPQPMMMHKSVRVCCDNLPTLGSSITLD